MRFGARVHKRFVVLSLAATPGLPLLGADIETAEDLFAAPEKNGEILSEVNEALLHLVSVVALADARLCGTRCR